MEKEYNWIYCPDCDLTLVFESLINDDSEAVQKVTCPRCDTELAEIRADDGCYCAGVADGHLYPGRPCCGRDL